MEVVKIFLVQRHTRYPAILLPLPSLYPSPPLSNNKTEWRPLSVNPGQFAMDKVSRIGQLKPIAFNGSLVRSRFFFERSAVVACQFRNADPRGRMREIHHFRPAALIRIRAERQIVHRERDALNQQYACRVNAAARDYRRLFRETRRANSKRVGGEREIVPPASLLPTKAGGRGKLFARSCLREIATVPPPRCQI